MKSQRAIEKAQKRRSMVVTFEARDLFGNKPRALRSSFDNLSDVRDVFKRAAKLTDWEKAFIRAHLF